MASALWWSLGGFLAGFCVGRLACRTAGTRISPGWWRSPALGLLILVLVTGTSVTLWRATVEQQRVTQCQAEFNARFTSALAERSQAAAAESQAQRELLAPRDRTDPAAGPAAVRRYLTALDELDRVRQANPLPDRTDCGEAS